MARHPDYYPGGPPTKIGHRHRLLILMFAMGKSNAEVATELGYNLARVGIIKSDPKIKLEIEHLQHQMSQETLGTFMDKVVAEAEPTLKRLKELRDQDAELGVALGASKELWESVVPKRSKHEEERTLKLVIEGGDFKALAEAIAVDKRKEIEVNGEDVMEEAVTTVKIIRPIMPEELERLEKLEE